ncbi:MAG: aminotransferase class V-fold PLP-dependent enzyme [Candidatus Sumerlaeaceae bacterium]|nr:aminotransferase class V-fold PLP-dependent enzyme [Candidatus Sumerlaeaceae bacterium]
MMMSHNEIPFCLESEFPIKEQYVFLNHAGVAPIPASTQTAITEFARDAAEEGPANYAAWLHGMAQARTAAAELLHTKPENVCFVHNTTHGVLIVANSLRWREGDNVVGFEHEFPANVHPWRNLGERGVEFRMVREKSNFTYSLEELAHAIDSRTRLVAVSWVEYATGVRNNLEAIAELCRKKGVFLFVDAIQGLGVLPIDVEALGIDFLAADGHKWLLAPEGCGILYVRPDRINDMNLSMCGWCGLLNPQDYDLYDQPYKPNAKRFEEGSHNLMTIHALGSSLRLLLDVGIPNVCERVLTLTEFLIRKLSEKNYEVITPRSQEERAGIVSVRLPTGDPAILAKELQQKRILVAARRGFLRISPHFYNDEKELNQLLEALP